MAVNKVVYGTTVLVDLTEDTVTADKLLQGYTAHDKSGALITGTADKTEGSVYQDEDGYLVVDDSESSAPQGNISITANGTYDVADYAGASVEISSVPWSWMGENPRTISGRSERLTFRELGADSWDWTTSSTILVAATANGANSTVETATDDAFIVTRVRVVYDYGDWSTPTNAPIAYAFVGITPAYATNYNVDGVYNFSTYTTNSAFGSYQILYYNSSSVQVVEKQNYGVNVSEYTTPTGSINGTRVTLGMKYPSIRIRGHATYFSETAFANLDFDSSYIDINTTLYETSAGTGMWRAYFVDEVRDILDNGISYGGVS